MVLRDATQAGPALAAELQRFVKAVTAPYKYPRRIEFIDELPKTASGKVLRRVLKARELEGPPGLLNPS